MYKYKLLKEGQGNLVYIHHTLLGKWIGNGLNLVLSLHFLKSAYTVLRTYIEVIQVWMFPSIPAWFPAAFFIYVYYMDDRAEVARINTINGTFGFYLVYVYVPFLYIVQVTVKKVRSRKQ